MLTATKTMNHSAYQKMVRQLSDEKLYFIIRDCTETIKAQKDFNGNCGYYQDEINYCVMELRRRALSN